MPNWLKLPKLDSRSALSGLSLALIVFLVWASLWSLFDDSALPPRGPLFSLAIIFVVSYMAGELVALVSLPPLLGMLVAGFAIGNAYDTNLDRDLSARLRSVALVIILLRAGLGLDPQVLRRLSGVCLRLAFTPCAVEAVVVAAVSHWLLDFPIIWGLLMGFVLAAVSPAVVVPAMIGLQERQLGTEKGIPTLVTAAASVDDVGAITGFGVCLGIAFNSDSSLVWSIFKGPVEVVIGLCFGTAVGVVLWYVPVHWSAATADQKDNYHKEQRVIILLLAGVVALFGSVALELGGAGALACLTLSFVAALKWRAGKMVEPVERVMKIVWLVFQPFLFALIGAEVQISNLKGGSIGLALVTLLIGVVVRLVTTGAVVFNAGLNFKERVFIAIAWLPKATVQAAIGPLALDLARNTNDEHLIELATLVLTIAVLSIMITAPLGALAIALSAPRLLTRPSSDTKIPNEESPIKVVYETNSV